MKGRSGNSKDKNVNVILGASWHDRKIRIRVQRKKGRTGVEVVILKDYSFEVGKGWLLIRSFKGGIVCVSCVL